MIVVIVMELVILQERNVGFVDCVSYFHNVL